MHVSFKFIKLNVVLVDIELWKSIFPTNIKQNDETRYRIVVRRSLNNLYTFVV